MAKVCINLEDHPDGGVTVELDYNRVGNDPDAFATDAQVMALGMVSRLNKDMEDQREAPARLRREMVREMALEAGFKLKPQPDGSEDLNPYVYEFADKVMLRADALIMAMPDFPSGDEEAG